MKLTREQKENQIKATAENLDTAKSAIIVNYQGLKVNEIRDFKKKLREEQMNFQILKNSLFKIALKEKGIEVDSNLLDQPVAVVWGNDEVLPSKLTSDFQKEKDKMQIIGGIVSGSFVDQQTIKQLASLPSRDELYAKLVGTLNAPMYRLVNALQGNLRSLVYILKQYHRSKI